MNELKKILEEAIKEAKAELKQRQRELKACWKEGANRPHEFDACFSNLMWKRDDLARAEEQLEVLESVYLDFQDAMKGEPK